MRYVSLFSGIEAASVAWEPLGWEPVAFSEIESFPCAVLKERYPDVPNLGDVCRVDWKKVVEEHGAVDLVVGGSPCQSFSLAGGRDSLEGESRLMFEFIRAVDELRPRWLVWENVPGALSAKGAEGERGGAFAQLLRELGEVGYFLSWAVLDAQYFGLAQRRERLFLVGRLGDEPYPEQVLFDPESLRWDPPQGKQKRQELAGVPGGGAAGSYTLKLRHTGSPNPGGGCGPLIQEDVSATLSTSQDQTLFQPVEGCLNPWDTQNRRVYGAADPEAVCYGFSYKASPTAGSIGLEEEVSPSLLAMRNDAAVCYDTTQITNPNNGSNPKPGDPCHTLSSQAHPPLLCVRETVSDITVLEEMTPPQKANQARSPQIVCMKSTQAHAQAQEELYGTLTRRSCKDAPVVCMADDNARSAVDENLAGTQKVGGNPSVVATENESGYIVRRLMPVECERLQGFPDGWTDLGEKVVEVVDWSKCPDEVFEPEAYEAFVANPRMRKVKVTSDTQRYKALGNSMPVPVMLWIGRRIEEVDLFGSVAEVG